MHNARNLLLMPQKYTCHWCEDKTGTLYKHLDDDIVYDVCGKCLEQERTAAQEEV